MISERVKVQVVNLWLNHNFTLEQIRDAMNVSVGFAHNVIKEYTTTGVHQPPDDCPFPECAKKIERRGRKRGVKYDKENKT